MFLSLVMGTAKRYDFLHIGAQLVAKARLATWGRSTPFPHTYRENRPIFRSMGFPSNQRWIMCRWSPQARWAPRKHPGDTSHTFSASCLRLPIRPACCVRKMILYATLRSKGAHTTSTSCDCDDEQKCSFHLDRESACARDLGRWLRPIYSHCQS